MIRALVFLLSDSIKNGGITEGPVNVLYWIDGKFGYALSAGINKAELARVATTVYDQLEKPS